MFPEKEQFEIEAVPLVIKIAPPPELLSSVLEKFPEKQLPLTDKVPADIPIAPPPDWPIQS